MPPLSQVQLGVLLGLFLGTAMDIHCEQHSLTYIYTALSRPVQNPGIHEFTAMGLLDDRMIDYYDSDLKEKVPKQPWMKKKLAVDYWTKGTDSRKSKQQWFKVNLDILKERMNQSDSEVHVLQWMHGCVADFPSEGKPEFQRGIDMYSYNGNSFLYFDDTHSVWVAAAKEAEPTKRKWDEVQVLKDYTKGYLEKECLDWLSKFKEYGQKDLERKAPPDVYMFALPGRQSSSVVLTCMATGFYPREIILKIKRNGRDLTEEDGVTTTGTRPNEDETYQRRDRYEILRTDTGRYICEVIHRATGMHIIKEWDGKLPDHEAEVGGVPIGPVVGGVIALVLLIAGIVGGVLWYRTCRNEPSEASPNAVGLLGHPHGSSPDSLTYSAEASSQGSSESIQKDKDSFKSSDSAFGSAGSDSTEENVPLQSGESDEGRGV